MDKEVWGRNSWSDGVRGYKHYSSWTNWKRYKYELEMKLLGEKELEVAVWKDVLKKELTLDYLFQIANK